MLHKLVREMEHTREIILVFEKEKYIVNENVRTITVILIQICKE